MNKQALNVRCTFLANTLHHFAHKRTRWWVGTGFLGFSHI